ncbi:hypothetical protein HA402_001358 [Bradysia odoriphaga]|nr:hypothetical protein HA402_001358 [Bradysia odoriphaga]
MAYQNDPRILRFKTDDKQSANDILKGMIVAAFKEPKTIEKEILLSEAITFCERNGCEDQLKALVYVTLARITELHCKKRLHFYHTALKLHFSPKIRDEMEVVMEQSEQNDVLRRQLAASTRPKTLESATMKVFGTISQIASGLSGVKMPKKEEIVVHESCFIIFVKRNQLVIFRLVRSTRVLCVYYHVCTFVCL